MRSAVTEAAAAMAELTGGVRENSGLLRRGQLAAQMEAQRGLAAAAMQVRCLGAWGSGEDAGSVTTR